MSMTTDYEYDPERQLWRPNRRFFLFGLAAGIIAPVLPDLQSPFVGDPRVTWGGSSLLRYSVTVLPPKMWHVDVDGVAKRWYPPQ